MSTFKQAAEYAVRDAFQKLVDAFEKDLTYEPYENSMLKEYLKDIPYMDYRGELE